MTTVQEDANTLTVTSPSGAVQKYALDGKPFSKPTDTGVAKAMISATARPRKPRMAAELVKAYARGR